MDTKLFRRILARCRNFSLVLHTLSFVRGNPVTETCVKQGSNRGQGPIRFLLLYRGSSPFTHCATKAGTLRHQCQCTAPPVPVHCATSARILGICQNFHETPVFQAYANILDTCRNFHKTPSFQAYANNFMRSQNFGYPPVISYDANILCIR